MSRTARRIRAIAKLVIILSTSAHAAETKRYLVRFKSPRTFAEIKRATFAPRANDSNGAVHLMSTGAVIGHTLDRLQLVVVASDKLAAVEALRANPNIATIEEEVFHPAPRPLATWGPRFEAPVQTVTSIARPWGVDAVRAPEAWAFGRGDSARTMVLDTGIDKEHPAIALNFEKGRNFTDDEHPDDIADVVGHGTHVSGTIAATGEDGGLIGVAPQTRLLMSKVCSERGCSSIAITEALNWAVDERVDVVNMSLGGMYLTQLEAEALDQAEAAGVFVAAASGNDGKPYIEYPAAYDSVLAVGAVGADLKRAPFSQYGAGLAIVAPGVNTISSVPRGTGRIAKMSLGVGENAAASVDSTCFVGSPLSQLSGVALVSAGLGQPEEFAAVDVKGKIAFIQRGTITFADKVKNAADAGAIGVLVYNNVEGLMQGTLVQGKGEAQVPAWLVSQSEGEALKARIEQGVPVQMTASVSASDYASFEGTSMATPHVSGVAALVRAANHQLTPKQVRFLLRLTAKPIAQTDVNEVGSGLVDAQAAVTLARAMRNANLALTN